MFLQFCFSLLFSFATVGCNENVATLQLLTLLPYTGANEIDGEMCQKAMQVAVDQFNQRQGTLLPDFKISPIYQDEKCRGEVALKHFFSFTNNETDENIYKAPVVIGTLCSYGCQTIGSIIHFYDSVQIAIGCNSPKLDINKSRFPNLIRTTTTSLQFHSIRSVLIDEVGNWQKLAIITDTNMLNYPDAISFYRYLNKNHPDVDITRFEVTNDVDNEFVNSLINRYEVPPRIIFTFLTKPMFIKFICTAYKHGIRGNRFVFISSLIFIPDYDQDLPPECGKDRSIYEQQLNISVWIGAILTADEHGKEQTTNLGYNLNDFEIAMENLTNGTVYPTYEYRHRCHDVMLQALITLQKTDENLRRSFNSSLLIEMRAKSKRDRLIGNIVKQTASSIEFDGLLGNYYFSPIDGILNEKYQISQLLDEKGIHRGYSCQRKQCREEANGLVWTTYNGNPPSDAPQLKDIPTDTEQSLFISFIVISCTIAVIQISFVSTVQVLRRGNAIYGISLSSLIILTGCIVLCPVGFLYAFNQSNATRETMRIVCVTRMILPMLSYSLVGIAVMMKLWQFHNMAHKINWRPSRKNDFYALISCFLFLALSCVYMAAWFTVSPREAHLTNNYRYQVEEDVIEHSWYWECSNSDQSLTKEHQWIGGFAFLQSLPVLVSVFLAYNTRNFRRNDGLHSISYMRIIAFKQAGIGLISLAVYICISTILQRNLSFATMILVDSGSTAAIVMWHWFISRTGGPRNHSRRATVDSSSQQFDSKTPPRPSTANNSIRSATNVSINVRSNSISSQL